VKSHSGSFTQGGTGSYTITVSNLAIDPSYGTVTVVDTPPGDLTITALGGDGWSCDVPTATCTRSGALAGGDSFPDITVSVDVDGNAAASVTNEATVSGGGDVDGSNNDSSDPTTIDKQPFPLTVSVTGPGTVDADTGAVSGCAESGGTCTGDYDNGTVVTLTASPEANANFDGWGGACSGTAATCEVTMDQARSVTASFSVFQPDLTIAKSHGADFVQGGTGTYTLDVSNAGDDPSYGTVTVVDTPPADLTITDLSGDGWTCDVPTATCTRSEALAASDNYPPITVTVSVDGNAAASVTNEATVSRGTATRRSELRSALSAPSAVVKLQSRRSISAYFSAWAGGSSMLGSSRASRCTRCGLVSAYRSRIQAPYECPHSRARVRPSPVRHESTQAIRSASVPIGSPL
jgi:uncharacterized repeat protein (TIGR01451 family)